LIAVAGMRWKIEENNGQGKDLLGLDQYQVRKPPAPAWEKTTHSRRSWRPADPAAADPALTGRDPPSARPHAAAAARGIDHVLHWSLFRRLHQTRALISHYRRRGDPLPAELRM
jgi:hypothetical protein